MSDKMYIDPQRPGIIRWNDDPTAGILAGIRAAEIVAAVNDAQELRAEIERLNSAFSDCAENAEAWKAEAERLRVVLKETRPFLEAHEFSDTEFGRERRATRDRLLAAIGNEQCEVGVAGGAVEQKEPPDDQIDQLDLIRPCDAPLRRR